MTGMSGITYEDVTSRLKELGARVYRGSGESYLSIYFLGARMSDFLDIVRPLIEHDYSVEFSKDGDGLVSGRVWR